MNLSTLLIKMALLTFATSGYAIDFIYKIGVSQEGVYRVDHGDLGQGDLVLRSASISLFEQGAEVPIHVDDGGDGLFETGDYFIFRGRHLSGESSWFNEFSRQNIYRLGIRRGEGLRMKIAEPDSLQTATDSGPVSIRRHLEQENLRVAFPDLPDDVDTEHWYWKRQSHLDTSPFEIPLLSEPKIIRVSLSGLSQDKDATRLNLPQHVANIDIDGVSLASREWNGQEQVIIEVALPGYSNPLSAERRLGIHIPRRQKEDSSSSFVDVVLLNWIELEYPFSGALEGGQETVIATSHSRSLSGFDPSYGAGRRSLQLFSPSGRVHTIDKGQAGGLLLDEVGEWRLVEEQRYFSPTEIRPEKSLNLTGSHHQADYLVIAHPSLMAGIEPLAEFHRKRGLKVAVVDVESIYNEFNHGIKSPEAIRNFVQFAWKQWRRPAPRYILLVGDATWNNHDPESAKKDLVPSMQARARSELAASDNGYVATDDADWRPQLAIGRLPAQNPQELSEMVGKILDYQNQTRVGPWRRNIAWITDRNDRFQNISNQLSDDVGLRGYASSHVYPSALTNSSSQDQQALRQIFDEGKLIVHFVGHGGRFVWRTGPPDYKNSSDLFSIEDVRELSAGHELPLVLSMTCSSGPFDHPDADSIAEEFLRLPNKGAIAVLAASWRVPASEAFSSALVGELLKPSMSVGEAIKNAKQGETNRTLVESYNLLGDPALQLSLPGRELSLLVSQEDGELSVSADDPLPVFEGGYAIVNWLDATGHTLATEQIALSGNSFEFRFRPTNGQAPPAKAIVYAWQPSTNEDSLGIIDIP